MGIELDEVRDHLSEFVDRVEQHHERVTVTRDGRPVVVLINPDDLAELEESLAVLSNPEALADIREGDQAYTADDVVRGGEAVRNLRDSKRQPSADSM
ncbi:MAG: type II toxin-antitoxin system Phd/YefM family antitoxin [Propionibacteriaceae bacterium]